MKRSSLLLSLLLGVTFFASSLHSGKAREFLDVPNTLSEQVAIKYLTDADILRGQGEGENFNPEGLLNRAEWAVIMVRYMKEKPSADEYGFCFPDITQEWFAIDVCFAKEKGLVKGFQAGPEAGQYIPANPLRLVEVLVMLQRLFDWTLQEGEFWYSGALEHSISAKMINENAAFDQLLTRAQASEILFRAIALEQLNVEQYDPILGEVLSSKPLELFEPEDKDETITEPPSKVSLLSFADETQTAPVVSGSLYVPVLRFQLESEKAVTLRELSVQRISVGRTEDISQARLMINGKILAEGEFFGEKETLVWKDLKVPFSAHGNLLVEMNIDFVEDALGHLVYQFKVNPDGIKFEQNVAIEGEAIIGQIFRIVALEPDLVSISNPSQKLKLPFVESEREIIGRFSITAGIHDVFFKRIRLEDAGHLNTSQYRNFRLSSGSKEIAFLDSIDNHVLDFMVDDYLIEAEESRTFTVRADILNAEKGDQIRLFMDGPEDLHAFDFEFGFGARVNNQFDFTKAWCLGSESVECSEEGLRKHCTAYEIEYGVRDCDEEAEEEEIIPEEECSDRLAPVCGKVGGTDPQTFANRCLAEKSGASYILPGPCEQQGFVCAAIFEPVCGKVPVVCEIQPCNLESFTFSNQCHAELAGAIEVTEGVCQ